MPKRVVETCSPGTECSDEEINALVEEYHLVNKDKNIAVYENPNVQEMKAIIEQAENYKGEWYHTKITLPYEAPTESQSLTLWNHINELGKDAGIYLMYEFDTKSVQNTSIESER